MTMTYTLWLWLSHITHDYDLSPLMTLISYHLFINNHHLWPMTYPSEPSPMTYHPQLITHVYDFSPMTVIHDYHPWPHLDSWLSSMTSLTYDYQDCYLWPSLITYHLWPLLITMTYDYHLSHIDLSPMTMLLIHDLSHVTRDYVFLHWPMTYDHHLSPMTYDLWLMTYDLWPMVYDYDLWPPSITSNYHLSPITVTHDLSITMTYHMSLMTYS